DARCSVRGGDGGTKSKTLHHANVCCRVVAKWLAVRIGEKFDRLPRERFERIAPVRDFLSGGSFVQPGKNRVAHGVTADAHSGSSQLSDLLAAHHQIAGRLDPRNCCDRIRALKTLARRQILKPSQDRFDRVSTSLRRVAAKYAETDHRQVK